MVHGENRIPYRIDRRLNGLAGSEYHATISLGCPLSLKTPNMGNTGYEYLEERRVFYEIRLPSNKVLQYEIAPCAFTPLAGTLKTMKSDNKHGSRRESHPLLDRSEIDWHWRT